MNVREGMRTPWGKAQNVSMLADGIWMVETSGHGGIKLDRKRQNALPKAARKQAAWYEEDCQAVIPMLAFFDEVASKLSASATKVALAESLWNYEKVALAALQAAGMAPALPGA